jgi:hypothetical protein
VYDYDNSRPGGTRKRRREILASFGREDGSAGRHPLRRLQRDVLRRRAVYAVTAIAVFALLLELVAIVVMRH